VETISGIMVYYSQTERYMEYHRIRHKYWNLTQIRIRLIYLEMFLVIAEVYYSQMARYMEYHRIRHKYWNLTQIHMK